ncbi:hypothetical protein RU639_002468 [Aspergillus parasiticus]
MNVASNKPILGDGNKGIIKVKGLRFNNGVSNIIFQNVQNSDLNPEYVWGERWGFMLFISIGLTLSGVDHVTTVRTGCQHRSFGFSTNIRVTLE